MTGFLHNNGPTAYLHHQDISALARHGFFGRRGGVSDGLYDSLNCGYGSDDDPDRIATNRSRVAAALGLSETRMAAVWQVHGTDVVRVNEGAPADRSRMTRADGMVTTEPGLGPPIVCRYCWRRQAARLLGPVTPGGAVRRVGSSVPPFRRCVMLVPAR